MVWLTVNPSLRAASCCSVDVVKGGAGVRFMGFFCIWLMVKVAFLHISRNCSTSFSVFSRVDSAAFTSLCEPSAFCTPKMPCTL